jgi:hypothetical protein
VLSKIQYQLHRAYFYTANNTEWNVLHSLLKITIIMKITRFSLTYLCEDCCSLGWTVYVLTGNRRSLLWWLFRCTWACHPLPCVVLPTPRYKMLSEWCRCGVWTLALWTTSCREDVEDADPWCVHELLATLTSLKEPCHLSVSLDEALPELVVTTLSLPAWLPSHSLSGCSHHDVCGAAVGLAVASLSLRNLKHTTYS